MMDRSKIAVTVASMAISGCIPPGAGIQRPTEIRQDRVVVTELPPPSYVEPVWEMRPVVANARDIDGSEYLVAAGDTLRGIGEKTGVGSETLARVNGIAAPFTIYPGQRLVAPAGRYHAIGTGESGIAIARAYRVSWSDIVDLNGLEEPFLLRIGQRLMLPPVSATSAQGLEERAAAFTLDIDDILTGGEPATDNVGAVPNPAIPRLNSETIENAVNMPDRFIGGFTWPASGQVARGFGKVGLGQFNQGIDLAVLQQSPISASGAGIVAFVGNNVANYGGLILIRHGEGWITAYGRITNPSVAKGQSVKQGQQIARAGNGGAPLLFFQIRKNMSPIDPISRLPQR